MRLQTKTPPVAGWKIALLLASGFAVLTVLAAAPAFAQQEDNYVGTTWPPLTTYVTMSNDNWVWAVGRLEGANGRIVWQRRLCPADGGIVIRRGWESTYIEVGARRFVLDNATGRAVGMGPNTYWVRTPGTPMGYPRGPYPPGPVTRTPTPPPTQTEVVPPSLPAPLPTVTSPAIRAVEQYGQALQEAQDAGQRLIDSLANAENLRKVSGSRDVPQADMAVARARQELRTAQSRVRNLESRLESSGITLYIEPGRLPTNGPPLRPAEKAEADKIQEGILGLTMQYNKMAEQLEGVRRTNPDDRRIADWSSELSAMDTQISASQMRLEELRTIEALRPEKFPNAKLQERFELLKENIRDISERLWIAQAKLREASQREADGASAQAQQAAENVLNLSKQRTEAYRELRDIAEQSGVNVRPAPAAAPQEP